MMASDPNWPQTAPESSIENSLQPGISPPITAPPGLPWTGWDVLRIAVFTLAMIFLFVIAFTIGAQKLVYPRLSVMEVARFPLVSVLAQLGAYVVVLIYMYVIATRTGEKF